MGRNDWVYITLPVEMGEALDDMIHKHGRRYGIFDRTQLIRQLVGHLISEYDERKNFADAERSIESMGVYKAIKGESDAKNIDSEELYNIFIKYMEKVTNDKKSFKSSSDTA